MPARTHEKPANRELTVSDSGTPIRGAIAKWFPTALLAATLGAYGWSLSWMVNPSWPELREINNVVREGYQPELDWLSANAEIGTAAIEVKKQGMTQGDLAASLLYPLVAYRAGDDLSRPRLQKMRPVIDSLATAVVRDSARKSALLGLAASESQRHLASAVLVPR
jgi:hypothetical protein